MSDLKLRPQCASDLALDRLLAGDLEAELRAQVIAHCEACMRCALRYETLSRQRSAFLERIPSWERMHAQHGAASRGNGVGRMWWGGGALVLAAGALLVFALAPGVLPNGTRNKGGPYIGAYVKHGERVARAGDGSAVSAGDRVRFTYSSDRPVHFALLNRDAQRATTYFPLGAQAERVAAGHDVALDFSIQLDAVPGREQVYGLFCEQPEPLEPVLAALQATGRLPPLPHCRVDTLTLEKVSGASTLDSQRPGARDPN